jgi:threonine/homoserine/homoserine lactone efflux protein
MSVTSSLISINNQTSTGFNQWDITQGFMGSNSVKQSSNVGITSYVGLIFSYITTIATSLFGANSVIIWVIGVLNLLAIGYLIYATIKFVRQGN